MAAPAHVRQGGPVDPLGRQHVDVVELGELLGRERFGWPEGHVAGIVHDDVDAAVRGDDVGDSAVDRRLGADIELDDVQVDALFPRVGLHVGDLRRVAAGGLAHGGVDRMAAPDDSVGRQAAEAARGAGDEDDLGCERFRVKGWHLLLLRLVLPPEGS